MTTDNHQVFIECGPGWLPLIEPILKKANELDATVMQVKEKFGSLRVYVEPGYCDCDELYCDCDELEEMIDSAEMASCTMCEMCGKSGIRMRRAGWYKTLCKEHASELGYKEKTE